MRERDEREIEREIEREREERKGIEADGERV